MQFGGIITLTVTDIERREISLRILRVLTVLHLKIYSITHLRARLMRYIFGHLHLSPFSCLHSNFQFEQYNTKLTHNKVSGTFTHL
jgi:hypothetical protein